MMSPEPAPDAQPTGEEPIPNLSAESLPEQPSEAEKPDIVARIGERSLLFPRNIDLGEIVVDQSIDESIDIDIGDPSSLSFVGLQTRARQSPKGDRVAELLVSLLNSRVKPQDAVNDIASMQLGRSLVKTMQMIADDIDGGLLVTHALEKHPKLFGTVMREFALMGEQGYGLKNSLNRYLALREGLRKDAPSLLGGNISYDERAFALTAGTVLDMSNDVIRSFRLGAVERPRAFRKVVARAMRLINEGESISDSLIPKAPLRAGFQQFFIDAVRLGEDHSKLPEMLFRLSGERPPTAQ